MFDLSLSRKQPNIKNIFYTITLLLPLLSYLLFSDLKNFDILLISFCTFLTYINLCIYQKLCIIPHKDSCDIEIKENDLLESTLLGFICLISIFLLQRIYKLF